LDENILIMATLKDLLDSGMSRDEINALLSQSYVGTDGFQQAGYEQGPPVAQEYPPSDMLPPPQYRGESMANTPQRPFAPQPIPQQPPRFAVGEDGLSRMTDRPGEVEQAPMNTIRNNSTGVVTQMPSSGQRSHDVWADGPQEIGRYQLANGTTEIIRKIPVMRDGRQSVGMERLIETPDYLNPAKFKQLEYQKREAEVRNLNERPKETGTWSAVESNGKQYLINNKTGAIKPAEVGGEQLMGKKSDAASKKESQMEGLGDAISQAKAILEGSAPNQKSLPTGSGVGSMWDALAGQVGATPAGATEAQRMKVLGGALTSKMPRMEGPQSDKDTQLYKEMAGLVGDDTVPIPRRLDALDQVSKLWLKYEKAKPTATTYDAEKEARYQEWKKARGM